ncbi:MAG: beta-1,3-glucanase family protein, partial [Bacteroidota bacterium]
MKNQTSQQLLGSLCLFLSCMLWACGSGSSSSDPSAPEMLSAAAPASSNGFQIVMQNQSTQFANSDIYWTAVCQNQSGAYCYIDSTGSLIPMSLADNTVSLGTAKNCNDTTTFANYSYPLASLDTLSIPGGSYINSAILYLSVDSFLPICVNKNSAGVITYAPPSFSNPSLQGYNTIFQAVEWTYNINADNTLNINTTNVDEVGMMILLELQDSDTLDSVGFKVSRSNLIQQFAACQDTNFRSLIIPGTSGDTLRILSPEHVMAGMGISSNVVQYFNDFYTDYIDDCWTFYNNKTITIYNNSKSFTGKLMRD